MRARSSPPRELSSLVGWTRREGGSAFGNFLRPTTSDAPSERPDDRLNDRSQSISRPTGWHFSPPSLARYHYDVIIDNSVVGRDADAKKNATRRLRAGGTFAIARIIATSDNRVEATIRVSRATRARARVCVTCRKIHTRERARARSRCSYRAV